MAAPALQQYVQGQGEVSADNLNTFEQTCDTADELRELIGVPGMQVFLRGIEDANDGGGGVFYWVEGGTADDGQNNFVPTGDDTGCWSRLAFSGAGAGVVLITSGSTYTAAKTDRYISINKTVAGAITINLPNAPFIEETHTIKDMKGDAAANNITIQGNGANINGSASATISANYGYRTVVYTGTAWAIVGNE